MSREDLDMVVVLRLLVSPTSEVRRDLIAISDSDCMDSNIRIHAMELVELLDKA